jgi:tetratricopeptide (TPR) repeat protein
VADVFLSYARSNAAVAGRVEEALEKAGLSVWYDPDLPAHRVYSDVIASELEGAKAVLVLWSEAAAESQWVRSEANRARELARLVQARLDGARLPMPFDQIQCADLTNWRRGRANAGWSQIERSIRALVECGPVVASGTPPPETGWKRRQVVTGGAVAAGAAAAGAGWWLLRERNTDSHVSPETAALMQQAKLALWQNTPEGHHQSIGIYRQVVEQNPTYADGWGKLAMSYALASHWRPSTDEPLYQERARSAAQQALSLDKREAYALVGHAFAQTYRGHWLIIERELRKALTVRPKDGEVNFMLAMLLTMTGRVREALDHVDLMLPTGPTPAVYAYKAQMLWSAGRAEELDSLLDEATKLYPTHFGVWFTRFYSAMMGGRPEAALAFAADTTSWPTGIDPEEIESVVRVAKAIQSRSAPESDAVAKEWMERAHHGAGYAENAAQFLASLRRLDDSFAVLRAYYFSEGFDCGEVRFERATGSFTPRDDRQTGFLFNPALASLRADQRFAKLVNELGLAEYWRASGRPPDYLVKRQ